LTRIEIKQIATSLFANSPFTEGKPNGYLSKRSQIWTDTELTTVLACSPLFLLTPLGFHVRKLAPIPGELPTLNDWENHLTTIFLEVMLKRYLEMRGADGGPWRRLCALPAFWSIDLCRTCQYS
ncbi:hypothetical protein HYC85_022908, partial [Camellia sinensis]